jgi:sensor histidine kinase YesM
VGLNNVRARLEQIYGERCRFEMKNAPEGGLTVMIEMPFHSEMAGRVTAT